MKASHMGIIHKATIYALFLSGDISAWQSCCVFGVATFLDFLRLLLLLCKAKCFTPSPKVFETNE